MQNISKTTVLIILLFACRSYSQSLAESYEIGIWYNFAPSAISYTFDDNTSKQLTVAVPIFDEYGYKVTLFTVTGWGPDWSRIKKASANGHEIASHTINHPSLDGLTLAEQNLQMKNSQEIINGQVGTGKCITIAYPNCRKANDSLVSLYYIAARGCQGYVESKTPSDFNNISSIICGASGSVNTASVFNTTANNTYRSGGWCVYLIHGIDDDGGYSPLASDILRSSLEFIKKNSSKYWVAPFGTVAKYIRERNSTSISELQSGDNLIVLVTDTLDNKLYNIPVTVRRTLPEGWTSTTAIQNGDTLSSEIITADNGTKYIMFSTVPDSGEIILYKNGVITAVSENNKHIPDDIVLEQNYPNPFNPSTVISFTIPEKQYVQIKIFDNTGREVDNILSGIMLPGRHEVKWNGSGCSSGVYYYQLTTTNKSYTRKLLLIK